jgi:hypothetical protein
MIVNARTCLPSTNGRDPVMKTLQVSPRRVDELKSP